MSGRYLVKGLFRIYTGMCKSFRGLWVKKIEFLAKNGSRKCIEKALYT